MICRVVFASKKTEVILEIQDHFGTAFDISRKMRRDGLAARAEKNQVIVDGDVPWRVG